MHKTSRRVAAAPRANGAGAEITSKISEVDEIKLHYLSAGQGPTVILLHGYTQTSHM